MTVRELIEKLNAIEEKEIEVAINGFEEKSCETAQDVEIKEGELTINEAGNWGHFYIGHGTTKAVVIYS